MSDEHLKPKETGNWRRWLNTLGPLLALLLVYGIFAGLAPSSFSTTRNLEVIARQTTIVGIAALGMTLIIIAGGIDLSVGSVVALSTVVIAWVLQNSGLFGLFTNSGLANLTPWVAAISGVAAAAFCGFVSGTLITRLRVVPFIVTLGMMLVVRGAAKGLGHEQKIDVVPDRLHWL